MKAEVKRKEERIAWTDTAEATLEAQLAEIAIEVATTAPTGSYARISGASQATAVTSGLAALALDHRRRRGLELGPTSGLALKNLLREAAQPLDRDSELDFGKGQLSWLHVRELIDDCRRNPTRREAVLHGSQLKLM